MKYCYQIEGDLRNNIGDVLQGMVAKRFLPTGAQVLNRENLKHAEIEGNAFFIANGWYNHSYENFPPPANIKPLYVSVHIAHSGFLLSEVTREHFKQNAPIGCRDHKTEKLFLGWGIPAYYSGCLTTTTLPRADINKTNLGECLLVDNVDHPIPEEVKLKLESLLGESLIRVSHDPENVAGTLEEYNDRSILAMEGLLNRYCKAKIILTTKIHCALPCMGMGANVVLIHPNPDDPRLDTVSEFLQIYSYEEIIKMENWVSPQLNKQALLDRQEFLVQLINEAVHNAYNPIVKSGKYWNLKYQAKIKAFFYGKLIWIMKKIRISSRVQRVYAGDGNGK